VSISLASLSKVYFFIHRIRSDFYLANFAPWIFYPPPPPPLPGKLPHKNEALTPIVQTIITFNEKLSYHSGGKLSLFLPNFYIFNTKMAQIAFSPSFVDKITFK